MARAASHGSCSTDRRRACPFGDLTNRRAKLVFARTRHRPGLFRGIEHPADSIRRSGGRPGEVDQFAEGSVPRPLEYWTGSIRIGFESGSGSDRVRRGGGAARRERQARASAPLSETRCAPGSAAASIFRCMPIWGLKTRVGGHPPPGMRPFALAAQGPRCVPQLVADGHGKQLCGKQPYGSTSWLTPDP